MIVYLEYDKVSKQVIEVHTSKPVIPVTSDYAVSVTDEFQVGDEFEKTIWINEVDGSKQLLSHSAIRNNPNAKKLLTENEQLKKRLDSTEEAILALMDMGAL